MNIKENKTEKVHKQRGLITYIVIKTIKARALRCLILSYMNKAYKVQLIIFIQKVKYIS